MSTACQNRKQKLGNPLNYMVRIAGLEPAKPKLSVVDAMQSCAVVVSIMQNYATHKSSKINWNM